MINTCSGTSKKHGEPCGRYIRLKKVGNIYVCSTHEKQFTTTTTTTIVAAQVENVHQDVRDDSVAHQHRDDSSEAEAENEREIEVVLTNAMQNIDLASPAVNLRILSSKSTNDLIEKRYVLMFHLRKTGVHRYPGLDEDQKLITDRQQWSRSSTNDRGESWLTFYTDHGGPNDYIGSDCPCQGISEIRKKEISNDQHGEQRHQITQHYISEASGKSSAGFAGAHVGVVLADGEILFGVVPTCGPCNSWGKFNYATPFLPKVSVVMVSLYRRAYPNCPCGHCIVDNILESDFPQERLSDMFHTQMRATGHVPDHIQCYRLVPSE